MRTKNFICESETEIYPDFDEDFERNLCKLKDRYGLIITFLFGSGISIDYDADRYTLEEGKNDAIATIRDNKTGNILYFLMNKFDRLSLVLNHTMDELVNLKIYNVL
jgi:hypothetical protein